LGKVIKIVEKPMPIREPQFPGKGDVP